MQRTIRMQHSLFFAVMALVCSIILLGTDIQKAYALSYQIYTTTGTQSDDNCSGITNDFSEHVWMICASSVGVANNDLNVFSENGTSLATKIVLSSTSMNTAEWDLLPAFAPSDSACVIIGSTVGNPVIFYKYCLDNGVITAHGTFQPASCTSGSTHTYHYDSFGLIWFTCTSEDKVGAFNPVAMTSFAMTPDLTDGIGIECDFPHDATADYSISRLFISCDTTNNIVALAFTISNNIFTFGAFASSTAEPILTDSQIFIDEAHRRIVVNDDTNGIDTYTYNFDASVVTVEKTDFGTAISKDCETDFYTLNAQASVVCAGTNEVVGFLSNSSSFYGVFSISVFSTTFQSGISLVGTNLGIEYYIAQGTLNTGTQKFLAISATDLNPSPAPPPSSGRNIIGGIDCNLPANANILLCRLGGDTNFGGIGNSTGSGLMTLACNVVFVSCHDTNPRTNGLGLLAFIASLFVIIGMFFYAIGKESFHMPLFIWIVIVVALSAFFTITGWIDPIFLILTIVTIIAMTVPKIISVTKGSTFGRGSTE